MAKPRAEHLAWAKRRALEHLDRGDGGRAIISIVTDLSAHPEFDATSVKTLGYVTMIEAHNATVVRQWIDGLL